MIIRPRKVRRSDKFTPRWVATARRRKEQAASYYSTAAIQIVLFFFLLMGAYRSYIAIEMRGSSMETFEKLAIPGFFLLAAVFILRAFIRNIQEARTIRRPPTEDTDL
jgi:hypothetical protein